MAWDFHTTDRCIMTTRLRLSSPEVVFEALDDYSAYFLTQSLLYGDDSLEQALAEREDRLINLALAKCASSEKLVAKLYWRAREESGDADYDKAVRLAVLSNRLVARHWGVRGLTGIDAGEFRRLAMDGSWEELQALLRNSSRRELLAIVYARSPPLEDLSDERWQMLVRSSAGNTGLNENNDSVDGPDFVHLSICKSVLQLVRTAPLDAEWVPILHWLLIDVHPWDATSAENIEDARALLTRGKGVGIPERFRLNNEAAEGYYTALPMSEEYRCVLGALYGHVYKDGETSYVGPADDPDVAIRCAHYANKTTRR